MPRAAEPGAPGREEIDVGPLFLGIRAGVTVTDRFRLRPACCECTTVTFGNNPPLHTAGRDLKLPIPVGRAVKLLEKSDFQYSSSDFAEHS